MQDFEKTKEQLIDELAELRRQLEATKHADRTERKQAEDALRKSEERFRSYFEQGLMGMAVSNKQMQWVEVNDRFCEILGYSKEEVLYRKITDFVHPADLQSFLKAYDRVLTGKIDHYTVDRRYLRKDGRVIYLNIFVKVFCSAEGTADHFLALFDDVTERIQADKDVREANRKLIVTLESITDGFVFIDRNWRYDYVNEAAARYLHKTRKEMLDNVCWDLFPDSMEFKFYTEFHRAMRENIPVHFEEFYPPLNVWYEAHCYPSPEGLSVYFRDVTQRKLADEALHRDHRTLKYLLQSSDHERQTIAYEIHDGLAQYLAGSLMQFQTYSHLKNSKPELALKAYEAAMTMLQQSHYEARRLIAGVRPPVLDEAGVVEAIVHLINEHNREKGPKIKFQSEVQFSRLISILENAVYRICQEALSNACKHSQSPKVRVRLLHQNDRIRIEIRDWGKGFSHGDVKDGCYGLAGIRERARLLGGTLRIQSASGKGTRIRVELPLMERAE